MNTQTAFFRLDYPSYGQAPDALLARAEHDAKSMFIEPDNFVFDTQLDTYPDDEDEVPEGHIRLHVRVTVKPPTFKDRLVYWMHYVMRR